FRIVRIAAHGADADAPCRSDSVQHHSAVHQRILRLERVGEPVELLEPGIGVVLAVLGVAGTSTAMTYLAMSSCRSVPKAARNIRARMKAPALCTRAISGSANSRSYSAACSARTWMTVTSSSLMTAGALGDEGVAD